MTIYFLLFSTSINYPDIFVSIFMAFTQIFYILFIIFSYMFYEVQYLLLFYRGLLLQKQNRLKEAVVSYQNAVKFRPRLAGS